MTRRARRVPALEPGTPEWLQLMTASKVASVLGVSGYDSARSMWHKMRGDVPPLESTKNQARGHYLEPGVLAWFFDQHPELRRGRAGTFLHSNGWAAATPDAVGRHIDTKVLIPVEAKTDAGDNDWGDPGTDEVPLHIAAQCMWTMHVLGAPMIYVPMVTIRLEFREYVVRFDAELAADIEAKCSAFRESLAGDVPPPIDSHPETYATLRRLNPDISEGLEVKLTESQARLFVQARQAAADADADLKFANSTIAEAMGTAQYAKYGEQLVARRQDGGKGKAPSLYAAKPLPNIPSKESSAAA